MYKIFVTSVFRKWEVRFFISANSGILYKSIVHVKAWNFDAFNKILII